MDSLFHFVFAFIAGMAVNTKLDHRPFWVALVALSAVLIDVDHLIFAYTRTFHSLVFVVGVPALLFYAAYHREKESDSITYQSLAILLFVMLVGHVIADMFDGGTLRLFYPFLSAEFTVPASVELNFLKANWFVSTRDGAAIAVYGAVIGLAYYAEEFIYFFEERHESAANALRDALRT